MRKLISKIVLDKERVNATIKGYIPLNMAKESLNYAFRSISRDTLFTVPTFDFYFKFPMPKPNKERIITERDILGRIVRSQVWR